MDVFQVCDAVPLLFLQALLDILKQDRKEAAEQRHELCSTITSLQGEVESAEAHSDKVKLVFFFCAWFLKKLSSAFGF